MLWVRVSATLPFIHVSLDPLASESGTSIHFLSLSILANRMLLAYTVPYVLSYLINQRALALHNC